MQYILKNQLLPFTRLHGKNHFYEFQAKQIKQKQLQQKQKLDNFLQYIQAEQQKQHNKNKNNNQNITLNSMNKSSIQNSSMASKGFLDFYQKNKKWKQNVDAERLRKKQQKIQKQQQQILQNRRPLAERDISFSNNYSKQSLSLHAFHSKGPISGWNQRFKQYIQKRLPSEADQQNFVPEINKKSRIIASRMVGKVEDRLMKFGEILKIRKHQMLIQQMQQIGKIPKSKNQNQTKQNDQSKLFYRLYKQAQITDRKNKQIQQKSEFSFKPSINQIPAELQKKIKQNRQKNPLYSSNKFSKTQKARYLQMYNKQPQSRDFDQTQFDKFMKRNQILIDKRAKKKQEKEKQQQQKQIKDLSQCTFIPTLNSKSMKIFEKLEEERSRIKQESAQYQYSSDEQQIPMQQNPSQLFSNIQPSYGNLQNDHPLHQNQNTFQYSESFKKQVTFDYEMNSPKVQKKQSGKWNRNNSSQKKQEISRQSPYHDPSYADSLEISQNKIVVNLIDRNRKNQQSKQTIQQIINLKKIQEQQENAKEIKKKSWQNQLDLVKNRLKKLMKEPIK